MTNTCRICGQTIDARTRSAGGEVCFTCATDPRLGVLDDATADALAFDEGAEGEHAARELGELDEECAPDCASRVPFGECTCGRFDRQHEGEE
jgi:hypothetical protein